MTPSRSIALFVIVASSLPVGSPQAVGLQGPGQAEPAPTSYQLIDRALEAKRIDEETAHKYRVFAAFGDSRLPAAYRGTDSRPEPPPEVAIAGSLLDTFSPQTRSELAPFFMRPDEPGSWITLATVSGQEPAPDAPKPPDGAGSYSSRGGGDGFLARYAAAAARGTGQSAWRSFPAAGGKAKVWAQNRYPGDAAKAQALANALTSHIWDKLTRLMGKTPKTDAAFLKNGGDDALDFYLVHAPRNPKPNPLTGKADLWDGWAKPSDPKNSCHQSRFILIDSNNPLVGNKRVNGILSIAAHELFHAIQFAYNTPVACDVKWIRESTATWAENLVYPTEDSEHSKAKVFLDLPHRPLDSEASEQHEYGAYLLPYFREMTTNNTAFMRTMWENFEQLAPTVTPAPGAPPPTVAQRIQAFRNLDVQVRRGVDRVLTSGFEETWPRFLVRNWNRPPVDQPDGYRKWDRLNDTVYVWGARQNVETRTGMVTKNIDFPFDPSGGRSLPYLAGHYQHFAFRPSVRSVVFHNTIAEMGQPHTSVWGIVKIRGTWKDPQDWTREFQLAWCRDDSKEDIEELAIVFGNSDWETEQPLIPRETPTVKAYPVGCTAWSGTTVTTNTITSTDPNVTITEIVRSSMRFIVDTSFVLKGEPRQYWKVESGTLNWQVNVTGACTGQRQGNLAIRDMGGGDEVATLQIWEENGKMVVSGLQGPWPADIPTYTVTCPGSSDPPTQMQVLSTAGWFGTDSDRNQLAADGKSFGGDFTSRTAGGGGSIVTRWQYSFRVAP